MKYLKVRRVLLAISLISLLFLPVLATGRDVHLAWDRNTQTGIAGYRIYYSNNSGQYSIFSDAGNVTDSWVYGLNGNLRWYFVATCYDGNGTESEYSNEVRVLGYGTTEISVGTNSTSATIGPGSNVWSAQ